MSSPLKDQPLSTLLNEDQCLQLTKLVEKATERMRSAIADIIEPSKVPVFPSEAKAPTSPNFDVRNPNLETDTATYPAINEETQNRQAERETALSTPQLRALKAAALEHFDRWRQSLVLPLAEVVTATKGAHQQGSPATSVSQGLQAASDLGKSQSQQEKQVARANLELNRLYPPIETPLASLPAEIRTLIVHSTLLLLLSLENYTSYSRVLLLSLASTLEVSITALAASETQTAQGLVEAAKHMSGAEEAAARAESTKNARRWKVGLASVGGAVLIGVTGGLAAPLVAAGIGSVMGGLGLGATALSGIMGTLAGSGVLVGSLFGAYGGRMTGQMMDSYAREVEDFAFLSVHGKEGSELKRRLRVTVGISGWLENESEVMAPWKAVGESSEVFALRWELDALMELGGALQKMVFNYGVTFVSIEIIKRTVLASLWAALWPLSLLQLARLVDNPFSVTRSRSEKAGEVLADALINKAQGERPVTLIGYSLGSRVIYSCLLSLAKRRAFGIVESVVMIGSPIPSSADEWRIMRTVISGRFVNVYSENDYILAFLYRTSSIQKGVAGLQPIEGVAGVDNFNVSERVSGHLRYRYLVGSILRRIGWDDVDMNEVRREQQALKLMEEREAKAGNEQEKKTEDERKLKPRDDKSRPVTSRRQVLNQQSKSGQAGRKSGAQAARRTSKEQMQADLIEFTSSEPRSFVPSNGSTSWETSAQEAKREAMESMQRDMLESTSTQSPNFTIGSQPVSKETSAQEAKREAMESMQRETLQSTSSYSAPIYRLAPPNTSREPSVRGAKPETTQSMQPTLNTGGLRGEDLVVADVEEAVETLYLGRRSPSP